MRVGSHGFTSIGMDDRNPTLHRLWRRVVFGCTGPKLRTHSPPPSFPDRYFDIKAAIVARGDTDPMVVSHITLGHLAPQLKSFLKS